MAHSIPGNRRIVTIGTVVLLAVLFMPLLMERSSPAHAQAPVKVKFIWGGTLGMTPSEVVRVCLGSAAAGEWRPLLMFATSDANSNTLMKDFPAQRGFRCVDTTSEELRSAGFDSEPSGRIQFELRIRNLPASVYGSIETMDAFTGETKIYRSVGIGFNSSFRYDFDPTNAIDRQ